MLPILVVTPIQGVAQEVFNAPASVDVLSGDQLRKAQLQINISESLVPVQHEDMEDLVMNRMR